MIGIFFGSMGNCGVGREEGLEGALARKGCHTRRWNLRGLVGDIRKRVLEQG